MAKSQIKAATAVLLAVFIIAGSIKAAAAACANVDPASTATYCSSLGVTVPVGATVSPCNGDPGCGAIRQTATSAPICVPLDSYCCAQPDCYAANTGGACKNGTTPACTATPGTPTTPTTPAVVPVTPGLNTTTPVTPPTTVPIAPSAAPAVVGGALGSVTTVNTTSSTITVCTVYPIGAIVR